jgi:hypothetical protein
LRDALRRFVRALRPGTQARRDGGDYVIGPGGPRADAATILGLIASGALAGDETSCRANSATAGWLRRAYLDTDAFAGQHRLIARSPAGVETNRAESPLSRLAVATNGEPFLQPHHIEAGERVRRLVDRAQLQPRLTMAYSPSQTAGASSHMGSDISDLAADARRGVAAIHRLLPRDCAGVVIDVCGLLKGLQEVERERGWPRRSAKLVLRIGLEQLAQHYGLSPAARGNNVAAPRSWMDDAARPLVFE